MNGLPGEGHGDLHSSAQKLSEFRGETSWQVEKEKLPELMASLKTQGFTYLVDLAGVDHQGEDPRFEVVYELCDLHRKKHIRIKTKVGEGDTVPTVSHVWRTADWHEREAWDMLGIRFTGHPDLRRILMWDGYPHHPLRKDFPLAGLSTEMPDIAFTAAAPLEGGPFVTNTASLAQDREPRAHPAEERSL
jgi:NADH-quinone oxidoreductase subunit C